MKPRVFTPVSSCGRPAPWPSASCAGRTEDPGVLGGRQIHRAHRHLGRLGFVGHLGDRRAGRGARRADQHIHLVFGDQLAGVLGGLAGRWRRRARWLIFAADAGRQDREGVLSGMPRDAAGPVAETDTPMLMSAWARPSRPAEPGWKARVACSFCLLRWDVVPVGSRPRGRYQI